MREVTVRQVGVWGEGGWTRDTPLKDQLVYFGARRESSRGPAHLHRDTALDFRPWRGRWDSARCPGSSVILRVLTPFQSCGGHSQRGHLHLDCRARNPGPKKAMCSDTGITERG